MSSVAADKISLVDSFRQAVDQRQVGDDQEAIRLFEEILLQEPESQRVRLELATSYFNIGEYAKAEEQVEQVMAEPGIPANVVENCRRFLVRINKQKVVKKSRHKLSGNLQLAYGYDNNANVGPTNAEIGDGLRLDSSSLRQRDNYTNLSGNLSHRYWFENSSGQSKKQPLLFWHNTFSALAREYQMLESSNLFIASIQTGPTVLKPGKWKWKNLLKGQHINLDDSKYATYFGVFSSWTGYGSAGSLKLTAEYRDQQLLKPGLGDSEGGWLNLGGFFTFNLLDDVTVRLGLEDSRFDAKATDRTYHALRYSMRTFWTIAERWSLSWQVSEREYRYDGVELPLYSDARRDDLLNHALLMSYTVSSQWRVGLKLARTHNQSNHALHNYERDRAEIQLRRQF